MRFFKAALAASVIIGGLAAVDAEAMQAPNLAASVVAPTVLHQVYWRRPIYRRVYYGYGWRRPLVHYGYGWRRPAFYGRGYYGYGRGYYSRGYRYGVHRLVGSRAR